MKNWILCLGIVVLPCTIGAQGFHGGLRAGLNFSNYTGPKEQDGGGQNLESTRFNTGFHAGLTGSYEFNEHFAMRAELLFSQKGYEYEFNGPSFFQLPIQGGGVFTTVGPRVMGLEVDLNYLELPLLAVGKFGRLELLGGIGFGFLVSARGEGRLVYSGRTWTNNLPLPELTMELDYSTAGTVWRR